MASSIYPYNVDNRSFKVILILSLGIHVLLAVGIFTFSHFNPAHILRGPVYTVHLTDMPSRGVVEPSVQKPLTAGSVTIPKPKPAPVVPHKEIKVPKVKPINDIPVIKPITSEPKPVPQPKITTPNIRAFPGKETIPGGTVLGAVKGENTSSGASSPGPTQTGNTGTNVPGAIEFPDPYYLQIIQNKVTGNWDPAKGILGQKKELDLMVYFTIDRKGKISDIQVEDSSGSGLLDQSALRAVQLSNPFPPLPSVFKEELLKVHFRFTYTS